jgi:CheY-like chemotaxis protein
MSLALKAPPNPAGPSLGRIMVLDDAPFDHAAVRRAAERTGLAVDVVGFHMAMDALDFLARPDRPAIDLLLVDLYMPGMGGLEFLAEAKTRFGPCFAGSVHLALTLAPDADLAREIDALGVVDGWVEKPVSSEALLALAETVSDKAFA